MYLLQRVEDLSIGTSDARKNVAEFVLKEQKDLLRYSIDEVAAKTFTSKSTVTRFAKLLGFSGWRDFLRAFVAEQKYQSRYEGGTDVNYPFGEDSEVEEIIERIGNVHRESIQDTEEKLDKNMLGRAVNYLYRAGQVVIFASSPNVYLGELFARKMLSVGKNIKVACTGEFGLNAYGLGPMDCALLISYSGNNRAVEPMSSLMILKEQKVPIIGITSEGDNYLRRNADCVLSISSRERLYSKIAGFATEESIGYILNVLFGCYYARDYEKNRLFKEDRAKVLERNRTAILKEMQEM